MVAKAFSLQCVYPEMRDHLPPTYSRLVQDWQDSSAGRKGFQIGDYWRIKISDSQTVNNNCFSLIPVITCAEEGLGFAMIEPDWEASPHVVLYELVQFDKGAGYPMAWFFYMISGNSISRSAGGIVANAVKDGLLYLVECDEKVLLRWRSDPYGF
ncbi:MAG: hypothetical protein HXX11_14570 [Desulfuromonadales bacterium]|nr:hypothetical protein [Desulfuromonadales bacterium]